MLDAHSSSSPIERITTWWISVSSCRQRSASECTPVISSSWLSLKSVVMFGWVSAEPSATGCGVSASEPSARTRRLSFSMPRRRLASAPAAANADGPGYSRNADDTLPSIMPATHGSPEEKESLLREDRRLLGRLLGEVIRSQAGEAALERIERIRQTAVRFHREEGSRRSSSAS